LKIDLGKLPAFREALIALVDDPATLREGERLLSELEAFEKAPSRHGQPVRSNGVTTAYCVGGPLLEVRGPVVFAVIIEESGEVVDARVYNTRGMKARERQALYRRIIRDTERKLGI